MANGNGNGRVSRCELIIKELKDAAIDVGMVLTCLNNDELDVVKRNIKSALRAIDFAQEELVKLQKKIS